MLQKSNQVTVLLTSKSFTQYDNYMNSLCHLNKWFPIFRAWLDLLGGDEVFLEIHWLRRV